MILFRLGELFDPSPVKIHGGDISLKLIFRFISTLQPQSPRILFCEESFVMLARLVRQ